MAEVINLRLQRKTKARVKKEKTASENRRKHGQTKEEKRKVQFTSERTKKHIDGHKRESDKPQ